MFLNVGRSLLRLLYEKDPDNFDLKYWTDSIDAHSSLPLLNMDLTILAVEGSSSSPDQLPASIKIRAKFRLRNSPLGQRHNRSRATRVRAETLSLRTDSAKGHAMKVKNCMHRGAQWVSPDTSVKAMASAMLEQDIGAIPVGENDRLIGMVTDRDIALRALANGKDVSALTARDIMTKGIVWCRDTD
jgi:signal-transduction protein with cAMP-binding, CBS, and nucleotidyltransferase domain